MTRKAKQFLLLFVSTALASYIEGGGGESLDSALHGFERRPWNSGEIILQGSAIFKSSTAVILTPGGRGQHPVSGRALYSRPLRFIDPDALAPASFATRFTFSIDPAPSFGDGLAFFVSSNPRRIDPSDGYFGLSFDADDEAIGGPAASFLGGEEVSTIAVEFDTRLDASLGDANDNHVALDAGSIFSVAVADAADAGVDLKSGVASTAWVEYNASVAELRVWLGHSMFRPPRPVLAAKFNLSVLFREFMFVGFSASNGRDGSAVHTVFQWTFHTFGFGGAASESPAGSPTQAQRGGADEEERINSIQIPKLRPNTRIFFLTVLGIVGLLLFLFFTAMAILYARAYLCAGSEEESSEQEQEREPPLMPVSIPLADIKAATNGFHYDKILGQDRSATVYDGVLPSGVKVAVKRFGRAEQFTSAFAAELAAAIGSCRHPNLVPFRGWCCESDELMLVYDHMSNGTLDRALPILPWDARWRIVLGVASALEFLHEECEKQIVHCDVNTGNVLLDEAFNARLGGLGLAELRDNTRPASALGYLAPEYIHSGEATEKADVYSFGVVALEVATGRRSVERGVVLVDWVWALWGRRRLAEAADPRLEGGYRVDEMVKLLLVGLCCAHTDCKRRPTMRKAVRMLQGTAALPALPAKRPSIRLLPRVPQVSEGQNSLVSGEENTSWFTPGNETD